MCRVAPSRQDLIQAAGVAMQRYQRSVQAFDDAVGRRLGLGPADLRCLDWLADGPKTAGALSTATGLRPAATTALIDRLSRRGLVRRLPSDADRRQVLVEMTEEGFARTWEAYGPLVEEGRELLAKVPLEELRAMRERLDAMRELTDRHRERLGSSPAP
ncbi:MAG TPA: MarR family transcriptional regulator [Pedococcus sp.]|jgi:DNA-binding MarR family transcriptional regulator